LNKLGGGFGPCARGDPTWPPWFYLKQLALARFNRLLKNRHLGEQWTPEELSILAYVDFKTSSGNPLQIWKHQKWEYPLRS
jgi:hypothetical protein